MNSTEAKPSAYGSNRVHPSANGYRNAAARARSQDRACLSRCPINARPVTCVINAAPARTSAAALKSPVTPRT